MTKFILDRLPFLPVFEGETGGAGAATQPAGAGADTVAGAAGASTVQAGAGTDTVAAAGGADTTAAGGASNALTAKPADKVTVPADFPTDWRERWAKGADGKVDQKLVDRLKRYDSPDAFARAGIEAQNRILAGKVGEDVPMPDPEKDADGAKKWREERGIPADPTGYKLSDDVTKALTDDDKPIVANFTAYAHKNNWTPAQVEQGVKWYTGLVEQQAQAQDALDKSSSEATQDALRRTWGEGFRDNFTVAQRFASEAIPGVNWFFARLPNDPQFGDNAGKMLGNIPGVVEALAGLGLLKWGDVSFAGGEAAKATEGRLKELKNIMDTDIDKWNANPAWRTEYYTLLEKQEKRPGGA